MRKTLTALLLLVALTGALAACGGDDDDASGADGISVTDAWARNSPAMADAGAVYMVIESESDDALVRASVPADVAGTVELHETVPVEEGTDTTMAGMEGTDTTMAGMEGTDTTMAGGMEGTDTTMAGMGEMTMRPVESIALPAGEPVALEPGGYHVMLLDLASPLEVGETFDVTLTFETGGEQTVSVEVRES
ncbi:MAG: copper chaperone PCu(A)C [Acidimicrobiales bacterium]|nr:copper chaperone PCu(A)C [Acidimicrobiales bacterium]